MLHHESYRSDTAHRVLGASESKPVQSAAAKQSLVLSQPSKVDDLLKGVATEALSPNQAAVIRQMLSLWLQDSKSRQA